MKTTMMTLALLCCTSWLLAQTSPKHAQHTANLQNTLSGCLMGSEGNLTLTDSTGIEYKLGGDTSRLSSHTHHQVEVQGKVATANEETTNSPTSMDTSTGTQGTGTATKQGVVQTFNVSKIVKVAGTCSETKK